MDSLIWPLTATPVKVLPRRKNPRCRHTYISWNYCRKCLVYFATITTITILSIHLAILQRNFIIWLFSECVQTLCIKTFHRAFQSDYAVPPFQRASSGGKHSNRFIGLSIYCFEALLWQLGQLRAIEIEA